MRAPKIPLALTILVASLAFGVASASAIPPSVNVTDAHGGQTDLSFEGTVNPHNLATTAYFQYFAMVNTTNCNSPDFLDYLTSQSTAPVNFDAVDSDELIVDFATGLPNETPYCYRLLAENADGANTTLFWYADETTSALPSLTNVDFDSGSDEVSYTATLTPNTGKHVAAVVAEYFEKPAGTCDEYAGTVSERWADGEWSGYAPVPVAGSVPLLQPNHTYCIRVRAASYHGYSNTTDDWSVITTVAPTQATIENVRLGENPNPGIDASLKFNLDDLGAGQDTGTPSTYSIYVFEVGAGRCTPEDYFGGDQLVDENNIQFSGEQSVAFDMDDLELGKLYCATIVVDSAWGDEYDRTVHVEVGYGGYPSLASQTVDAIDHTRIGATFYVTPNYLVTDYGLEYFVKDADECVVPSTGAFKFNLGTQTANLSGSTLRPMSVDNLEPNTTYCVRGWVRNSWGESKGDWAAETTAEQPPQAEIGGVLPKPTDTEGMSAKLAYHVNDMGAYAATFNQSYLRVQLFSPAPENCDPSGISGMTPQENGAYFSGDTLVELDFANLTPGTKYCVRAIVDSAWIGSDNIRWDEFVLPAKPSITDASASQPDSSSLKLDATLGATWLDTDYELRWYKLSPPDSCGDDEGTALGSGTTTGLTEPASAKSLSNTITGLEVGDIICWHYGADNRFGEYWNDWEETTIADVDAPTKPTGLIFTNVTQTSATLSWTSSDNVGVDYYILKNPVIGISNPTTSSTTVSLSCGESKSFKVIAVDAAGNSSEASDVATVTAAACPVTQQPPTEQPPAKQCFDRYSKKVSGKSAKGKKFSATITGAPSADGQSISFTFKASGKGASGAKAGFASSRTGKTGKAAKRTDDTPLYFKYASGKKFKTLLLPVTRSVC